MFRVEVKSNDGFTTHSNHASLKDAIDQADMVRGRVIANVPDGIYFLHPEGSKWLAVKFNGGGIVDDTEEANADTHRAANDAWANIVPSDSDSDVDGDIAKAIVQMAMGDDTDPAMVVVTKR
jgi:hypothetical protein